MRSELQASQGALKVGKPVFVLDFGAETPAGNRLLLQQGGRAVISRADLVAALDELLRNEPVQGELPP